MICSLLAATEPPVTPDRDEARRWAIEELAKPQYPAAQPSWLDQLWRDFLDWLASLDSGNTGPNGDIAVALFGALAVVLVIVAVILVRPRLNARRRTAKDVFDGEPALDADVYRSRASAAAGRSDWQTAVVEQFRALVRSAEDRTVIEARAGRTADEAAAQLGQAFGPARQRLDSAATVFDAVRYGKAGASAADYEAVRNLDADLEAMKPAFDGDHSVGFAVPL
ncbi:DUF4129 domain-containing protein [Arthrobacter cavernae]|uniref:DUF4129 domain-containing protein n=1 Tax=Arthrobacter cavernae TaxID=2817681 RepID=A0A939HCV0_9MICC|nr:DUF4129 domain-containing protein [Arthrobacter cavernae]MBO1266824.1 DUF4129 domain-containing protein [Arthrobacter cavernae]